ncbi:unnamed protein product [Adineta ricciae]|uniref:TTF-type domain-containing protein n=1 Tax=Adineta ricciae TaxID=249248 RepID=A0A815WPG9_ADIRI|nr:unnamed protein product [Adineta ricciae]
MSDKQIQITFFFKNKKQKTSDNVDRNSAAVNTTSGNLNQVEDGITTFSPTSPSSTTASPIASPLSTAGLLSSITITSPSSMRKLKCEFVCCTSDKPFVPETQVNLKASDDKRSCQLGWFVKYKWLSFCQVKMNWNNGKNVYCYYCRNAFLSGFHPESNKIGETTLTCTGFTDWKNAISRFSKHESGKVHHDCVYLVNQQQKPTVAAQLSLTHQAQQSQRRRMLFIEVECIRYLLRQGLALRGHIEEEGNLLQLLKLREADVDGLSSWIKEGNYLSHQI